MLNAIKLSYITWNLENTGYYGKHCVSVCSFLWHYKHQELLFQNKMKTRQSKIEIIKMENEVTYID
jgi:hypothetical protein